MKKKYHVIGIGEILWDILPDGKLLGGAPANSIYHLCQLGANGSIVSRVGNDPLGHEIIASIKEMGIENLLSMSDKATGTVTVELKNGTPSYTIHEEVAWDEIELTDRSKKSLADANAICLGSLAQRNKTSRKAIWQALEIVPEDCLKVFDINLRQSYYTKEIIEKTLHFTQVFKLNQEELTILTKMFALKGTDQTKCEQLIQTFNLKVVALTRDISGSLLISQNEYSERPTPIVEVADTIGAGDSFTATLTMGLLNNAPLRHIHEMAVEIAAYVCTQKGATPHLPPALKTKAANLLEKQEVAGTATGKPLSIGT